MDRVGFIGNKSSLAGKSFKVVVELRIGYFLT